MVVFGVSRVMVKEVVSVVFSLWVVSVAVAR